MTEPFASGRARPEPVDVSFDRVGGPLHLPSLTEQEKQSLLVELVPWVQALCVRFGIDTRAVPPCWLRHPGMVEALSALRDAERGAYAVTAPASAAVEFLQALRFVHAFLVEQTSLTGCTGQSHRGP